MGQILHGSARTTAAVRRAIQHDCAKALLAITGPPGRLLADRACDARRLRDRLAAGGTIADTSLSGALLAAAITCWTNWVPTLERPEATLDIGFEAHLHLDLAAVVCLADHFAIGVQPGQTATVGRMKP